MRAASLALGYPDSEWRQSLPLLHAAARAAGGPPGAHLRSFLSVIAASGDGALLRFTAAYRAAGFELASGELPDHLAVLCEFAAAEPDRGRALFRQHRAGVELLRTALDEAGAPWLHVVDAVRAVLPGAAPRDLRRALHLARTGPPAEEVGLEPFAPPEYMGGRR